MKHAVIFVALFPVFIGCNDSSSDTRVSPVGQYSAVHQIDNTHLDDSTPSKDLVVEKNTETEPEIDADAGMHTFVASPLPSGKPMLLDFTRDHCMPCTIMSSWVDDLQKKYAGKVGILKINIDRKENRSLGMFFRISAVPTQVYVDKTGREIKRNTGLATQVQMEKMLTGLGFLAKK